MTGMTKTKDIVKVIELHHGAGIFPHRDGLGSGWTNGNKNIFIEGIK